MGFEAVKIVSVRFLRNVDELPDLKASETRVLIKFVILFVDRCCRATRRFVADMKHLSELSGTHKVVKCVRINNEGQQKSSYYSGNMRYIYTMTSDTC
jgi:hypothetical protein